MTDTILNHPLAFREAAQRVGDEAGDFWEVRREWMSRRNLSLASLLKEPWKELPQVGLHHLSSVCYAF